MGNTNTKPFGVKDKIGYMCGDIANDFTFIFASSYVMVFTQRSWESLPVW